jgi:hypothetical protein
MKRVMLACLITVLCACGGDETSIDTQAVNPGSAPAEARLHLPAAPTLVEERLGTPMTKVEAHLDRFQPPTFCAESACCATWGWCTRNPQTGKCFPGSSADCLRSVVCRNFGYCTRIETEAGFRCLAGSDEDCERSFNCKDFGVCRLGSGNTCE